MKATAIRQEVERALAIYDARKLPGTGRADGLWVLAQMSARDARQRPHAERLAREARELFAGAHRDVMARQVDQWFAARTAH